MCIIVHGSRPFTYTRAFLFKLGSGKLALYSTVTVAVNTITHIHIFRPGRVLGGSWNRIRSRKLISPGCDKKVSTQTWQSYKCLIFITVASSRMLSLVGGLWAVDWFCGVPCPNLTYLWLVKGLALATFGQHQPGPVFGPKITFLP